MDIESRTVTAAKQAEQYRQGSTNFAHWAAGYGVITHSDETQVRVHDLATRLHQAGAVADMDAVFTLLAAADRVASAAMWLVVHMTYARNVYLDGRDLSASDFKTHPEGHTGGSLNMVPAYTGYLAANTLTGLTRSWLMGQGHCVSAIDATNLLIGNMTAEHAQRYEISNPGLTRFVRDFYSYAVTPDGKPESPLGSHVNAHTAGGMMEGGYLGFAELQYVHMPLPGEHLVTFLSDGAFEEQRGSDWTPRWWRAEDCGLVAPFMIMNGRRIDQRSSMAMKGGSHWFSKHLELNGFTPLFIDGRDPASFAWGIIEMESGLNRAAKAIKAGDAEYPAPIYYAIAEAPKGYGFPGAGTNRAHNLPLRHNPAENEDARKAFNLAAQKLWLEATELDQSVALLNQHTVQNRPREKDHPLAHRQVPTPTLPEPAWLNAAHEPVSAMQGIAEYFIAISKQNPALRVRLGNPDEIKSNRMGAALELFQHRVTTPEEGVPEDVHGKVITALNEEAVINAVLGNKGGLNLLASYEAFMVKMLGAIRQELIFARHLCEAGRPPGWLTVPVIATSHTWENGKNEQSHQDTTFCEALLNEMTDVSRVLFPADWNSAIAALQASYSTHGQIWTLVIPKRPLPVVFSIEQAQQLAQYGAVRLRGNGNNTRCLQLVATGGYQLAEVLKASERLDHAGVEHSVIYLQEPGRFRTPRDQRESGAMAPPEMLTDLFPESALARVFVTHTRPEPLIGVIWPLLKDPVRTPVLGYINRGGTLNEAGMLFANRSTWAHALVAAASALGTKPESYLSADEYHAVTGEGDPAIILDPQIGQLGGLE